MIYKGSYKPYNVLPYLFSKKHVFFARKKLEMFVRFVSLGQIVYFYIYSGCFLPYKVAYKHLQTLQSLFNPLRKMSKEKKDMENIKLMMKGKDFSNGIFNTNNIETVIDLMQERMAKAQPVIFSDKKLWKVSKDGQRLIHETIVSYTIFDIVRM